MKIIIIVIAFVYSITCFAQKSLSDYSYVIVPDQYEFLNLTDKYQLNSLTVFLFNKNGFHAFLESNRPKDVKSCEGLTANVENAPSFLTTKLTVTLTDCNGTEVYRSLQGKTKEKEFKKAFYEALRKAFVSIEGLHVIQNELVKYQEERVSVTVHHDENQITSVEKLDSVEETSHTETVTNSISENKVLVFKHSNYKIVSKNTGFTIFYNDSIIGSLIPSSQKNTYLVRTKKINGIGFLKGNTFVLEIEKENNRQLSTLVFTNQ